MPPRRTTNWDGGKLNEGSIYLDPVSFSFLGAELDRIESSAFNAHFAGLSLFFAPPHGGAFVLIERKVLESFDRIHAALELNCAEKGELLSRYLRLDLSNWYYCRLAKMTTWAGFGTEPTRLYSATRAVKKHAFG